MENIIVVDVETTGLNTQKDEIIELGSLKVDLNTGRLIDTFSKFANPRRLLSEKIIEITNITDDMLKDANSSYDVVKEWHNWIGEDPVILVCHNAKFDINFIVSYLKSENIPYLNHKIVDTLLWSRNVLKSESYKLEYLAEQLNLKDGLSSHRAKDDCMATMRLLVYLTRQEGATNSKDVYDLLCKKSKNLIDILERLNLK